MALADPTRNGTRPEPGRLFGPVDSASVEMAEAAIQLMRIARLLPAALIIPLPVGSAPAVASARMLLIVETDAVAAHGPMARPFCSGWPERACRLRVPRTRG